MSKPSKELLREFVKSQNFESPNQIINSMKELFKDVLQEVLEVEMENHLGYEKHEITDSSTKNSRNGYSKKTLKTELGEVQIDIPRDRNAEFEPMIVQKHQRKTSGIEEKIISLYGSGLSTRDIAEQVKQLYDIEISADMVTTITHRILPLVTEWQNRPLLPVYAFVYMDAIHYKVREDGRIISKAAYVVLGVDLEGRKDVLGIWVGMNESSRFWLSVLNDMKTRGVEKVLIFCVDGLNGFSEAIKGSYPRAKIQRCIVHHIRSSMKYVSHPDRREFAAGLKLIYSSVNENQGLAELDKFKEKWNSKYPTGVKSWYTNWEHLSTFFEYDPAIRRIIYTTNAIESLHSQYRKVTRNKLLFPNDEALLKLLYLVTEKIVPKWKIITQEWDLVSHQLAILFKEELSKD